MEKKALSFTLIAVAAAATAIGVAYFSSETEEGHFTKQCVDTIKERLIAPATFKLDKSELIHRSPATYETLWGLDQPQKHDFAVANWEKFLEPRKQFNPDDYEVLSGFFYYDASNAFGTPLRSIVVCSVGVRKYAEFRGTDLLAQEVMIDGFTTSEWLQASISSLQ